MSTRLRYPYFSINVYLLQPYPTCHSWGRCRCAAPTSSASKWCRSTTSSCPSPGMEEIQPVLASWARTGTFDEWIFKDIIQRKDQKGSKSIHLARSLGDISDISNLGRPFREWKYSTPTFVEAWLAGLDQKCPHWFQITMMLGGYLLLRWYAPCIFATSETTFKRHVESIPLHSATPATSGRDCRAASSTQGRTTWGWRKRSPPKSKNGRSRRWPTEVKRRGQIIWDHRRGPHPLGISGVIQGGPSGHGIQFVDIKLKVLLQYELHIQCSCSVWPTGYGKKLSRSQAPLGQATCLAVA